MNLVFKIWSYIDKLQDLFLHRNQKEHPVAGFDTLIHL